MLLVKKTIIVLLLLFFFSSLTKNLLSFRRNVNFYQTYKQEYESEKKKNNELKMLAVKTSDTFELEKTIRNRLNLVKKNETMVIVPSPTPFTLPDTPTPAPVYQQWLELFFKN